MKSRVKAFNKYRLQIQAMDDGDLPIAKYQGKHYKEPSEEKRQGNRPLILHEKKEINYVKVFVITCISLLACLIVLGIFLALKD